LYFYDILIVSLRNATFEGKGASKSKTGSVTVLESYAIFCLTMKVASILLPKAHPLSKKKVVADVQGLL
jgi:hypothetical protein